MEASAVSGLAGLGAAGAVILAMFYYLQHEARRDKLRAEGDQKILDRIDKIVDRHLASEDLNRQQIQMLSESNRELFDRVINICLDLSNSIKELTSGARASEKVMIEFERSMQELRAELRSLGGPPQPKALGHDEPRPFGPG